ncbi:hypothetical protein ACFL1L_00845 [Thermoplasmatota archaeon]
MRKYLIVSGIVFVLLIVNLSGCNDILETPKIEFIQEDGWLIVSFVEKSIVSWDNINITISSGKYSDIGFHYSPEISSLIPYGNGNSCPSDWGVIAEDNGIFFQLIDAIVTLYWIPTNVSLGEWNFT